ncbi:hypothetical protein D3C74_445580 [compost metagenome]
MLDPIVMIKFPIRSETPSFFTAFNARGIVATLDVVEKANAIDSFDDCKNRLRGTLQMNPHTIIPWTTIV